MANSTCKRASGTASASCPESWIAAATSAQVPNAPNANPDWEQGYGFQFWQCRHGAYRGDGAFGQFCVVLPAQEAVLAITSGVGDMQAVLDRVWEHLLPAMGDQAQPAAPDASATLADRLQRLRIPPVAGRLTSAIAGQVSGREYVLKENAEQFAALGFDFAGDGSVLRLRNAAGDQSIPCGFGSWQRGELILPWGRPGQTAPVKVAASGAWVDDQTYTVDLWLYETPFRRSFTCHFVGDRLTVDQEANVAFGQTDLPRLEGVAEG